MAFVVSGTIVSKVGDGPEQTFHAGDAWWEPEGAIHRVSRDASSTEGPGFRPKQLMEFETSSYTATPKGQPSSIVQHDAFASSWRIVVGGTVLGGSWSAACPSAKIVQSAYTSL
jgi:hypothetical protein